MPVQVGTCAWNVQQILFRSSEVRIFENGGQMFFTDTVTPPISLNALSGGVIQSNTLDEAYNNFGGGGPAGAGRIITSNANAVRINKPTADANNAFEVVVTAGTGLAGLFSGATISCPDGAASERFGQGASAPAASCTAIGSGATATAAGCTVVGTAVTAAFASCVIVGFGSTTAHQQAVVIGAGATVLGAGGLGGVAIGLSAVAGDQGVSVGRLANSGGQGGIAIGQQAQADESCTAVGWFAAANFFQGGTVALGNNSTATGLRRTALGAFSTAGTTDSTCVGNSAMATGTQSTAIGSASVASGAVTTVVGYLASATGALGTSIGRSATTSGVNTTAVGASCTATAGGVAIGANCVASGSPSIAIGSTIGATGLRSIGIGDSTLAASTDTVLIGFLTTASGSCIRSVGLGGGVNVQNESVAVGFGAIAALGDCIAIGSGASSSTAGTCVGRSATAGVSTVAVGRLSAAMTFGSVAIGDLASVTVGTDGIAIGETATVSAMNAIAIGFAASATAASAVAIGPGALGAGIASVAIGSATSVQVAGVAVGAGLTIAATNTDCVLVGSQSAGLPAGATNAVGIGRALSMAAAVVGATVVGFGAIIGGSSVVVVGAGARATGSFSVALGAAADCGPLIGAIALGAGATCSLANQLMVGAGGSPITQVLIGNGATSALPTDLALLTTASTTAGVRGADLTIAGGAGGAGARSGRVVVGPLGSVAQSSFDVFASIGVQSSFSIPDASFPYTVLDTDHLLQGIPAGLGRVVTLPSTGGRMGRMLVITKVAGAATSVVITPAAGDTIDGAATFTLTGVPANQSVMLKARSDTANWVIMANR